MTGVEAARRFLDDDPTVFLSCAIGSLENEEAMVELFDTEKHATWRIRACYRSTGGPGYRGLDHVWSEPDAGTAAPPPLWSWRADHLSCDFVIGMLRWFLDRA